MRNNENVSIDWIFYVERARVILNLAYEKFTQSGLN